MKVIRWIQLTGIGQRKRRVICIFIGILHGFSFLLSVSLYFSYEIHIGGFQTALRDIVFFISYYAVMALAIYGLYYCLLKISKKVWTLQNRGTDLWIRNGRKIWRLPIKSIRRISFISFGYDTEMVISCKNKTWKIMLDPDEKKNIKQVAEFIRSLIEQRISVKCLSQKTRQWEMPRSTYLENSQLYKKIG